MLRWLPKKLSDQAVFFLQLYLFVALVHLFLIGICLFVSRQEQPLDVRMNAVLMRPGTVIAIMPFAKKMGHLGALVARSRTRVSTGVAASTAAGRPVFVKRSHLTKLSTVSEQKSISAMAKKRVVVDKRRKHKKGEHVYSSLVPHEHQKAPQAWSVVKPMSNNHDKGRAESAKVEPARAVPAKAVQGGEVLTNNLDMSAASVHEQGFKLMQEIEQPMIFNVGSAVVTDESDRAEVVPIAEPVEVVVVGGQEYEAMQAYQEIHDEVAQYWQPPLGLVHERPCVIIVAVDQKGRASQVIIEQSSGVLAYDMSARMAAYQSQYPQAVWMQHLRLHF